MYQSSNRSAQNGCYYPKSSAVAGTNTVPDAFTEELKNYCNEREREKEQRSSANRKLKSPSICKNTPTNTNTHSTPTNCPLHSKKDLNKLEECYWAQWKPSKTTGIVKGAKCNECTCPGGIPRFPYINTGAVGGGCQNCQRLLQSQVLPKPKCHQCSKIITQLSSTTDYSEVKGSAERIKFTPGVRFPFKLYDETTDCECMTTAREGETTEFGYTEVGMARDVSVLQVPAVPSRQGKKTSDKAVGVCCPCQIHINPNDDFTDAKPIYVNKSCFTGSSEMLLQDHPNEVDDEVPVRDIPRGVSKHTETDQDHHDSGETRCAIEPLLYHCLQFDMEDRCCGSSDVFTQQSSNSVSSNAQKSSPPSSNPLSAIHSSCCVCNAKEDLLQHKESNDQSGSNLSIKQIHPLPDNSNSETFQRSQLNVHDSDSDIDIEKVKECCSCSLMGDNSTASCINHTNELVKHMKRLSEYIPTEAQSLVQEMANIITSEPIQEIKRQAERILECALVAEAENQRKSQASKKSNDNNTEENTSSNSNTLDNPVSVPVPVPVVVVSKDNNSLVKFSCEQITVGCTIVNSSQPVECPETPYTECTFLQDQKRLKRDQEQLIVQEQLRKFQQQQMKQQIEDQRKLLEEHAKEIQRQRDLQKKQALLQQQEQQLKLQAQAHQARLQQLDAASLRLKLQQELANDVVSIAKMGKSLQLVDPPKKAMESQEKTQVGKKPSLSAAVARVTGVLRHSYPLGKSGKKSKQK